MSTTLSSLSMGLRRTLLAIGLAAGFAASAQAATAPSYQFLTLGVGECCGVSGINNAGQAIGGGWAGDGSTSAMVWTETSLTGVVIGTYSWGVAINDAGASVGYNTSRRGNRAAYWDSSVALQLQTPGGNEESQAKSINQSGQIVGTGSVDGTQRALMWQSYSAQATILPSFGGTYLGSSASAINDAGLVVGRSELDIAKGRATLWTNGVATDLGVLHVGDGSEAYDINNAGQIIGVSGDRGVRWENGNITELGLLDGAASGTALDINNLGQMVGISTKDGQVIATLWDGQNVIDLNQFVQGSGWVLETAVGINDQGWVVGRAHNTLSGEFKSYMLISSQVPEPNALVLTLLGGGALALARRRKKSALV